MLSQTQYVSTLLFFLINLIWHRHSYSISFCFLLTFFMSSSTHLGRYYLWTWVSFRYRVCAILHLVDSLRVGDVLEDSMKKIHIRVCTFFCHFEAVDISIQWVFFVSFTRSSHDLVFSIRVVVELPLILLYLTP